MPSDIDPLVYLHRPTFWRNDPFDLSAAMAASAKYQLKHWIYVF